MWTPGESPGAALPVMDWIYRGGFSSGSASKPIFNGELVPTGRTSGTTEIEEAERDVR